jgi:hypothetical protein
LYAADAKRAKQGFSARHFCAARRLNTIIKIKVTARLWRKSCFCRQNGMEKKLLFHGEKVVVLRVFHGEKVVFAWRKSCRFMEKKLFFHGEKVVFAGLSSIKYR